jgi:hypothetical protein
MTWPSSSVGTTTSRGTPLPRLSHPSDPCGYSSPVPAHPDALVLPALFADAARGVRGIGHNPDPRARGRGRGWLGPFRASQPPTPIDVDGARLEPRATWCAPADGGYARLTSRRSIRCSYTLTGLKGRADSQRFPHSHPLRPCDVDERRLLGGQRDLVSRSSAN